MSRKIGSLNTLFIINRICDSKHRWSIAGLIDKYLDTSKFNPKIEYSEYPGHAKDIARENVDNYQIYIEIN